MSKEYNIAKTVGQCSACGKALSAGEELVATVADADEELRREDFCTDCWQVRARQDPSDLLGVWRTRVPRPQEKKKLFIDDELLVNFFQRLEGTDEPPKINFRFVLALVLMRKKLLVYERAERLSDGREVWAMHLKGSDQRHQVIDPHMDEDKVAEVGRQLSEILEGEL